MNRPLPSLLTCIATCVLAIQPSPVLAGRSHAAPIVAAASASAGTSEGSSRRTKVNADRKGQRERSPTAAKAAHTTAQKPSRQDVAEARKAAALEQAQARARADDLYAASQTNAPIIVDAKACKRIGANGESIYENC
ncbi:MAG TPA: hypothetical protein VK753_08865 [Xanthomonadaceae bacterium]|jgi:hypothetical protein|nr:hypothetical protein [Xanthomonadaceae bacterium]